MNKRTSLYRAGMSVRILSIAAMAMLAASCAHMADTVKVPTNPKKLKVVVLMGQSNMVGYADPRTAWYLTQPMYVPPAKIGESKSERYSSGDFYWTGLLFAHGDSEEYNARGPALSKERKAIIKLWRGRYYENFSRTAKKEGRKVTWNYKEWGPPPHDLEEYKGIDMRGFMPKWLYTKVEEAGVFKRMRAHIESPENKLHPSVVFKTIAKRNEAIAEDIKRVREIFLKGTNAKDFDALDEAAQSFGRVNASNRMAYTELVNKHINLPIPERTYISALGAVAGETFEDERQARSQGPLSLGYTRFAQNFGPEYPFGVSFERMVDGPILLIKCAWGGKSLQGDFRPPSLNTEEEPTGLYWKMSMEHIQSVLADPGKYHPDYDPKEGYEMAGLVWFQGWNDNGNTEYGKQLVTFIKDFRKELKAPRVPVVCGLLGHAAWKQATFNGDVNAGMLYASRHPDLKGTVDIVNTVKYYPVEFNWSSSKGAIKTIFGEDSEEYKTAAQIYGRATRKDGVHYHGSAKFMYLTGDAMARKLANLMAGGEPTIFAEADAIAGGSDQ